LVNGVPDAEQGDMAVSALAAIPGDPVPLDALDALAQRPSVQGAVAAVREFLGLDVAYTNEIVGDTQHLRVAAGDAPSFHLVPGLELPLEQTVCTRVLAGEAPNLMPDVTQIAGVRDMAVVGIAGIGSFATVPLRFSDGRLYGTLCAAGHAAAPQLGERDLQFLHVFARIIADQLEREELQERAQVLEQRIAGAHALMAAVEVRDAYTGEHSAAVVVYAVAVARTLGMTEAEIADVEQVARLHDVGKLAIPDAILHKPGPLNDAEWTIMRTHPAASAKLVAAIPGLSHLAGALRAEHERWDGGGYPDGLAGDAIPMAARITFVCDAYHAMTSDRPYRASLGAEAGRAEIVAGLGTQFCPTAGAALLQVLDES
jgi:hypothetical protein